MKELFSDEKLQALELACRERGLPVTVQRRLIMDFLARRTDHPSADQIYEEISQKLPGISRTTVYRVLDTFVTLGVIRKVSNTDARVRFDAQTARHHHVQCFRCGAVADICDSSLDFLPYPTCAGHGFTITDYSISFTGICAGCSEVDSSCSTTLAKGKEMP